MEPLLELSSGCSCDDGWNRLWSTTSRHFFSATGSLQELAQSQGGAYQNVQRIMKGYSVER